MSSSDMRIIKDAKISRDPVVIAMHKFERLDLPDPFSDDLTSEITDESNEISDIPGSFESSLYSTKNIATSAEKILQDAKMQSERLLTATSQEIARMKILAAEEGERLKVEAMEEGKQQGLAEAQHQIADQLQQAAESCNTIMEAALLEARQTVLGAENQIVELVLAISRKIIYDELDDRPEVILGIVRAALERVRDQNHINIHVSLDDYERILQARNELQSIVGAEQILIITADTVLVRGGCMIETSFGTVEAGVDTQLESIRRALQEIRT